MSQFAEQDLDILLRKLFGKGARCEGPLAVGGAGRRFTGIDLGRRLTPEQVTFLLDALGHFGIVSIPGQDLETFSLAHFERFANHWGAPVPHPATSSAGGNRRRPTAPAMVGSSGSPPNGAEWRP